MSTPDPINPTLRRDGAVVLGRTPIKIGRWSRLTGPGYLFECTCGESVQRFGQGDLREKIALHIQRSHRRATT